MAKARGSGQKRKVVKRARASGRKKTGVLLPDPASIIAERSFVSSTGVRYSILTTTETDSYDPPLPPAKKRDR